MTSIDLTRLSPKALQKLINAASSQMDSAKAKVISDARTKIEAVLSANDLSIEDVYPSVAAGKSPGKGKRGRHRAGVGAKYRNPDDPSQTWGGMGRKPLWFKNALRKRGVTEESMLIAGGGLVKKTRTDRVSTKKGGPRRGKKSRAGK